MDRLRRHYQSKLMIGRCPVLLVLGWRHVYLGTMVECHLDLVN